MQDLKKQMGQLVEFYEHVLPDNTSYELTDFIVYYFNKYELHEFFGNLILKVYKKEDPEEQQIWTTSVQRLSFMVRQILNKENVWLKDMNGVCIIKHIIDPLLDEIKRILQRYIKSLKENQDLSLEEIEKYQDKGMIVVKIIKDINNKYLQQAILKYLVPHFQLDGFGEKIVKPLNEQPSNIIVENEKKPTKKTKKSFSSK